MSLLSPLQNILPEEEVEHATSSFTSFFSSSFVLFEFGQNILPEEEVVHADSSSSVSSSCASVLDLGQNMLPEEEVVHPMDSISLIASLEADSSLSLRQHCPW